MTTTTTILIAPQRLAYRRLVRASAVYDLAVTAAFATPWTFTLVHAALDGLSGSLGLSPFPELDLMQVLYANLMGSVVVVWSLLRLLRPERVHGLLDGVARVLFSAWMAYALAHGGPDLLWPFLIVEAAWGVLQLAPWFGRRFRNRPV
ncbi:hypothetical protein [Glycomyces harbinensis]|uniref:DUF4345 domain-containing protein n=1 Tax=Glycomyces harbinensis TaxID=58114 RepID=A0A1G7BY82_9ACTN|nr:hypothetical protein [Glycomyces harbinensis]SDE32027.1 hypothetical protein SAMN05216270_11844 [Glycomyces harbinensis]